MPYPRDIQNYQNARRAAEFCVQMPHSTIDGMAVMAMASFVEAVMPLSSRAEKIAVVGEAFDIFADAVRRQRA